MKHPFDIYIQAIMQQSIMPALESDSMDQALIMERLELKSDDTKQTDATKDVTTEHTVFDANRNKSTHKLSGQQSNNRGKKNKKNIKWQSNYSAIYITNLGDLRDSKWKRQIAGILSNCEYKRLENRNWRKTGMNNF